jgi:hypothetical protein
MKTFYGLMAEFETAEIPLEKVCLKYFNLDIKTAAERAGRAKLPVPAYRAGTQKSQWLVSAHALAEHLDERKKEAESDWRKRRNAA